MPSEIEVFLLIPKEFTTVFLERQFGIEQIQILGNVSVLSYFHKKTLRSYIFFRSGDDFGVDVTMATPLGIKPNF